MKTQKFILTSLILLLGFVPATVRAQTLTLQEVIEQVKKHPRIRQAEWEVKEAKAARIAESWLMDPMVGVTLEEIPLNNKSLGNADMTSYSVSQEIPFPTVIATRSSAMGKEVKSKQAMLKGAEQEKIFEAKKTYVELLAAQNRLKAKREVLSSYNQIVAVLTKQYETGAKVPSQGKTPEASMGGSMGGTITTGSPMTENASFSDVAMAKMKKAEVEAEIYDLHHQVEATTSRLNILMGREPDTMIRSLENLPVKSLRVADDQLEQKVFSQNSDLKALDWMVKKSRKEVSLAAQKLIPTVEPMFMYNRRQNMENAYTVGVNMNFPLWFHRNVAEISQAKAASKKMAAELEAQKATALTSLHELIHHAKEHYKIVNKYRGEIVPLARSAFTTALTGYEARMLSSSNLLQKLINYHDASGMYWEMWMDYQMDYAMLEWLVGEEL